MVDNYIKVRMAAPTDTKAVFVTVESEYVFFRKGGASVAVTEAMAIADDMASRRGKGERVFVASYRRVRGVSLIGEEATRHRPVN